MTHSSLSSALQKSASALSLALHPLLMSVYAGLYVLNSDSYIRWATHPGLRFPLLMLILTGTFIIPSFCAIFLWRGGYISSPQMPLREERTWPFFLSLLSFIGTMILLWKMPVPRFFFLIVGSGAVLILWAALVNLFWKISVHMAGIGGFMAIILVYSLCFQIRSELVLSGFAVLAGLLAWARIYQGAHNAAQVYAGFLGGFALTFYWLKTFTGCD